MVGLYVKRSGGGRTKPLGSVSADGATWTLTGPAGVTWSEIRVTKDATTLTLSGPVSADDDPQPTLNISTLSLAEGEAPTVEGDATDLSGVSGARPWVPILVDIPRRSDGKSIVAGDAVTGSLVDLEGMYNRRRLASARSIVWDWGDATAPDFTALTVDWPSGWPKSERYSYGQDAGHVYRTPGTYSVSVSITFEDGSVSTLDGGSVTIADPETIYEGHVRTTYLAPTSASYANQAAFKADAATWGLPTDLPDRSYHISLKDAIGEVDGRATTDGRPHRIIVLDGTHDVDPSAFGSRLVSYMRIEAAAGATPTLRPASTVSSGSMRYPLQAINYEKGVTIKGLRFDSRYNPLDPMATEGVDLSGYRWWGLVDFAGSTGTGPNAYHCIVDCEIINPGIGISFSGAEDCCVFNTKIDGWWDYGSYSGGGIVWAGCSIVQKDDAIPQWDTTTDPGSGAITDTSSSDSQGVIHGPMRIPGSPDNYITFDRVRLHSKNGHTSSTNQPAIRLNANGSMSNSTTTFAYSWLTGGFYPLTAYPTTGISAGDNSIAVGGDHTVMVWRSILEGDRKSYGLFGFSGHTAILREVTFRLQDPASGATPSLVCMGLPDDMEDYPVDPLADATVTVRTHDCVFESSGISTGAAISGFPASTGHPSIGGGTPGEYTLTYDIDASGITET